ncbi:FAD-dependent oxidoreductase [Aeromicrobium sp. CF3.5]|uniref:FAD-dependent oxidoreductase n=1 Tax=Aeromicrobium sp. CF3.5 TaxID=3373078 RepID=UPI003EE68ADB
MTSLWRDDAAPISTDSLDGVLAYDDIVVGAGLTGLTTALMLARAGRAVLVLEAKTVGAVATGNTTAKLSMLQGTQLSTLRRHHSRSVAQAYVDGNSEGQQWLLRYCAEHEVVVQRRDAVTYANGRTGIALARAELKALRAAGLAAEWVDDLDELPFETQGGVRLADQAQFDPMDVLAALARDLRAHGGVIHEGLRVTGVSAGSPCEVQTEFSTFQADRVVIATGSPILDRGLAFAKTTPKRSYCVAFEGVDPMPEAMYLAADPPSRSLRTAPRPDGTSLFIVGGAGHGVGRARSPRQHVDQLREWTAEHFSTAHETHWWSAQDYSPIDHLPLVGAMPRGGQKIFVATGFDKWGMTNAVAAALTLSATLLGGSMPWAARLARRKFDPLALAKGAQANAEVGSLMGAGQIGAQLRSATGIVPSEGQGQVGRGRGVKPTAVSTVDGTTCAVSALCSHLGGVVTWNDAEKSWDCPLHGSRFAPDGTVLEGPATAPLAPRA